ncbi:ENTH-domain-containing protein [Ascobolus immersus RN42]|uniref:ENTH-domain-containing protein n=1 Tax=Ascobolus immersus RN42 TaxID=1160509 RepID=A0A3N4I9F8_ASCIM|nr:ENTH-domain-containing protein [Ascobolus immersus RN42]
MNIESLRDAVSSISLYDVKAAVRKAQNVVMNYTEMEAKVREATNNEPWGASSTIMNEIASGTHNYQLLSEIMPIIYKRFTEKGAEEWRQIYKALQLLEFLIKNGSEQVIDDARSHLHLIKMLRQFHYIDEKGKDQGVNVRNRAKELAELLQDVEKIRSERKKARANRSKYGGVEGGAGFGSGGYGGGFGGGASSSRYGGFGNDTGDSYGGYSGGGVYGDGGGTASAYPGASSRRRNYDEDYSRTTSPPAVTTTSANFEVYDEFAESGLPRPVSPPKPKTQHRSNPSVSRAAPKAAAPPPKAAAPMEDLLSLDDGPALSSPPAAPAKPKASSSADILGGFGSLQSAPAAAPAAANNDDDDDDFADFVSASPAPAAPAAPAASSNLLKNDLSSLFAATPSASATKPLTTSVPTSTPLAAPKPFSTTQAANLSDLVGFKSASASPAPSANSTFSAPLQPANASTPSGGFKPMQPNYFTSVPLVPSATGTSTTSGTAASTPAASAKPNAFAGLGNTKPAGKSGSDAFGNIWSSASSGLKKSTPQPTGPKLGDLAKQQASAGIWGSTAGASKPANNNFGGSKPAGGQTLGNGLDDLLG